MRDQAAERALWDAQADSFDEEADHGLTAPRVRAAWWSVLSTLLPAAPARIVDLGCGTASVGMLLAEHGYHVTGLDLSPRMIERARAKVAAAGLCVDLGVGDVTEPAWAPGSFEVVFARHVVWALPDPEDVLRRWTRLLTPGGRLVLVEGRWGPGPGAGLTAGGLVGLVSGSVRDVAVRGLDDPDLWGRAIDDERYVLTARL